MQKFEYKVVPAPKRGEKVKGLKTGEARFAHTLEGLMNDLGAQGWQYQRADTLPAEERSGLTSKTTVFQNVLVFRRAIEPVAETADTPVIATPEASPAAPAVQISSNDDAAKAPSVGPAVNSGKPSDSATVAAE